MLRVFEAFAGYGGASFGLRRSGVPFKVVGQSDINKDANRLLAANFPEIRNYGDITKLDPKELPDFDLFTGGFPCQPFSSMGNLEGEKDYHGRGTLLPTSFMCAPLRSRGTFFWKMLRVFFPRGLKRPLILLRTHSRSLVMVTLPMVL